jgi:hypothetical protein
VRVTEDAVVVFTESEGAGNEGVGVGVGVDAVVSPVVETDTADENAPYVLPPSPDERTAK